LGRAGPGLGHLDLSPGHATPNEPAPEITNAAEAWLARLREELKWLGDILGSVRDADVRLQSLETHSAKLAPADSAAAEQLLKAASDQRRSGHEQLGETLTTGRYLDLLRALDALANGPAPRSPVPTELWVLLSEPAATGMPALAHRQWRTIGREVRRLSPEPPDEALHHVRIQAKRLRYLAEVAAPVVRPSANRDAAALTAKAATALQDVLGDLHDAVVTEEWLRETARLAAPGAQPADLVAAGVAAGELIAVERETQQTSRAAWSAAWHRLNRKGHRSWASDGQ
jgi:CHAD domain-containing protein